MDDETLSSLMVQMNLGRRNVPLRRAPHSNLSSLNTSQVSLLSHTHGRERRQARGIEKRELKEAVKHGRKERANPGRGGEPRWRFTHKGVVYITDVSTRYEITSWRIDGEDMVPPAQISGVGADCGAHVVLVVDHSGSMVRRVPFCLVA